MTAYTAAEADRLPGERTSANAGSNPFVTLVNSIGDPAPKWMSPSVFAALNFAYRPLRSSAQRDPKPL